MFNFPLALFSNNVLELPVKTNLLLHLDSSNLSSITVDGSNLVSQWNDLSGLNNHVYQSNNNLKPTYTTAIQNNLAGVRWINNNTVLRTATNASGKHCFIVARHLETGSNFGSFRRLIDRGDDSTSNNTYALFGVSGSTDYSPGSFARNIASNNVWINRVNTITASPFNTTKLVEFITTNATTAGILAVGSHFSRDDLAQNMVGYIFEVILYSDTKSSSEITSITNYLNNKWLIY
jgi:hypothetical protein